MLYPGAAHHARARRAVSHFNRRQEAEVHNFQDFIPFMIIASRDGTSTIPYYLVTRT